MKDTANSRISQLASGYVSLFGRVLEYCEGGRPKRLYESTTDKAPGTCNQNSIIHSAKAGVCGLRTRQSPACSHPGGRCRASTRCVAPREYSHHDGAGRASDRRSHTLYLAE